MVYGYCRISTNKQNIERQERNIRAAYPDAMIVKEAYTGTSLNRKEWGKLMKIVKRGDTLVFDSVSRMSRNAEEGFEAYQSMFSQGINLVFLKEPHINTDTYKTAMQNQVQLTGSCVDLILEGVNKYLLTLAREQIKIAFDQAEKEVADFAPADKRRHPDCQTERETDWAKSWRKTDYQEKHRQQRGDTETQ